MRENGNLLVKEINPKPGFGSIVRIIREQLFFLLPNLINVFKDEEGLNDWLAIVNEDWDFLVNRI